MIFYKSKDFKTGLKLEINNEPYIIIDNEFVNPGKGQAFNRLKLKHVVSGLVIRKTVKLGEKLKSADLFEIKVKYLYSENDIFNFIDESSYEYYDISIDVIGESRKWLKEGISYIIIFWNDKAISFKPPNFIELCVISSEDVCSSSVISKVFKNATLETGVTIKVPLFVKVNDIIKIDTEKSEYVSRIN